MNYGLNFRVKLTCMTLLKDLGDLPITKHNLIDKNILCLICYNRNPSNKHIDQQN